MTVKVLMFVFQIHYFFGTSVNHIYFFTLQHSDYDTSEHVSMVQEKQPVRCWTFVVYCTNWINHLLPPKMETRFHFGGDNNSRTHPPRFRDGVCRQQQQQLHVSMTQCILKNFFILYPSLREVILSSGTQIHYGKNIS